MDPLLGFTFKHVTLIGCGVEGDSRGVGGGAVNARGPGRGGEKGRAGK